MTHSTPTPSTSELPSRPGVAVFGFAILTLVLVTAGYLTLRDTNGAGSSQGGAEESELQPGGENVPDYTKWNQPVAAIVLSGQMHGYVEPCGCTFPQFGGLDRRYNFIQSLKAKKWDVLGIDLGDLPQTKGIHAQNVLKYKLSVDALATMDYKVLGIGKDEIEAGLGEYLTAIWDKKAPLPRPISLTLEEAAPGKMLNKQLNLHQYEIIKTSGPTIGVINMVGPDARVEIKNETWLSNQDELPRALLAFAKAGVDFGVILHHEHPNLDKKKFPKGGLDRLRKVEELRYVQVESIAKYCVAARKSNPKIPPIQLMMVLMDEPEPPSLTRPIDETPTQVVEIGHKGKYVGLVGIFRDKKAGYRVQYQSVLMKPELETKKGQNNPVIALMEQYNNTLKREDMLAKWPRSSPHLNQMVANGPGLKATYVGSERCGDCHDHAYSVWKKTPHSHATETLEKKINPAGAQFDPECMRCHTTGFEHPGGYYNRIESLADWKPNQPVQGTAAQQKKHNDVLRGVGCETCHGPGSEHVKNPANKKLYEMMNPFAQVNFNNPLQNQKIQSMNQFCMKCHDNENDVHWGKPDKELKHKWKDIIHRTPGKVGAAPDNNEKDLRDANRPPIVIEVIDEKKK